MTAQQQYSDTHRRVAGFEGEFRRGPAVAEDCQEEQGVGDHQQYRVHRAAARVRARHFGLDGKRQEVAEEDQQASLSNVFVFRGGYVETKREDS